jgi:1,2-diacylglycerol 3-alpha-glucosyltransferase
MKIVMMTDAFWPRVNGLTVAVETFRKQLTMFGHEVFVVAPRYPENGKGCRVPDDDHVFRFPSFAFPLSPEDRLGYPGVRKGICQLLGDLRPDVVHAHSELTIGFAGKSYCAHNPVAHVMTCHTYWENYIKTYVPIIPAWLSREIVSVWSRADYRLIDWLTVPTQWLARLMASYRVNCPISVVPNGIIPGDFSLTPREREGARIAFSAKVPDIAGRDILLYAGRVAREKNIDLLLEMMLLVRKARPDSVLVIAGDGPDAARLKGCVRAKGLSAHVRFAGYLTRKELSYAHSVSRIFVFASKTETQGLVLLEAMMCRAPIVAVRSAATVEVLVQGCGGYLAEESASHLSEKVLLLLSNEEKRLRMSAQAWKAAQCWTAEKMTEKLLEVYEKAIASRRGAVRVRRSRRSSSTLSADLLAASSRQG